MNRRNAFAFIAFAIAFSATSVFPNAEASEYRYRYKDTLWDGSGNLIIDNKDTKPTKFECPAASGIFGDNYVEQVSDDGCYYDEPTVVISAGSPPLKGNVASASEWCARVYAGSKPVAATEMILKGDAASFASSWSADSNVTWFGGVTCAKTGNLIQDPPAERVGVLRNADFEAGETYQYSLMTPYWSTTGYRDEAISASTDKSASVGGTYALRSYSNVGGTVYQAVDVDPALASQSFPVSVEWLQSSITSGSHAVNIRLEYLNDKDVKLGEDSQPATSTPWKGVYIQRFLAGTAPVGTSKIRVNVDFSDDRGMIDNIALKINDVDVSQINGGYGFPARPADNLLNAGAENGTAFWNWNVAGSTFQVADRSTDLIDPLHLQGTASFSPAGYPGQQVTQQVWLGAADVGKPFTMTWQQAERFVGGHWYDTSDDIGKILFYKADGTLISSYGGGQFNWRAGPNFWMNRSISGTVPSNAAFMVVEQWYDKAFEVYVDNIGVSIGGRQLALTGLNGSSAVDSDLCPNYTNTVSAPDGKPWSSNYLNTQWYAESPTGNVHMNDTTSYYRTYCAGKDPRYIVGDYDLLTAYGWGDVTYTAFDAYGTQIDSRTFRHSSSTSATTAEHRWDVWKLPAGTAFVRSDFSTEANTLVAAWYMSLSYFSNINLTMNGSLPADQATVLRNGAAQAGLAYWDRDFNQTGVLGLVGKWSTFGGDGSPATISSGSLSFTCADQNGASCGIQQSTADFAFHSVNGSGSYYQDIYIPTYGFKAGDDVSLGWDQSVSSFVSLTSKTVNAGVTTSSSSVSASDQSHDQIVTMALMYYDQSGNLISTDQTSPMKFVFENESLTIHYDFTSKLPANTYRIRMEMTGLAKNEATVDNIVLKVGNVQISRPD